MEHVLLVAGELRYFFLEVFLEVTVTLNVLEADRAGKLGENVFAYFDCH